MLTVVYCTKETKPGHKEHLIKSSGLHKHIEVIEIINNGESLTVSYNRGLKQAKNDVVVFCHDDITIETKQWGKKLLKHYDKNEEFSILGVAGTKHIGTSGRWWDDKKAMYGRVKHTHEGKTWVSKYSSDLGTNIEEVVLVDGVFFSVKQSRLKETFDETVEGYHFYDVDFCFRNTLAGTKVGVHSNIVINHQSIGITNDPWEANRVLFSEKYKDNLPLKIDNLFNNVKINLLVVTTNKSDLELLEPIKKDVDIILLSDSDEILSYFKNYRKATLNEPPGYKVGDGNWGFNTPDGKQEPSTPNKLYRIGEVGYDAIFTTDDKVIENLTALYPEFNISPSINKLDVDNLIKHINKHNRPLIHGIGEILDIELTEKPLINIITRTSGRPNAFKRCVESVKTQTYQNINHIIITDNEDDVKYINDNGYDNCIVVDRKQLIHLDESVDPNTGAYSPHNLYFNEIKHLITDGWVIHLDDDDLLMNDNSVELAVKSINDNDEDTIIYWKMNFQGKGIPTIINDENPPKLYNIGAPCFTFNHKYMGDLMWDGWKCADYRAIEKLHNIIPRYFWLDKELILIPTPGSGNKKDI